MVVDGGERDGIDLGYFFEDLSTESSTRVAGAFMIILGSLLGVWLGLLLIAANPGEVLSGSFDSNDRYSDVSGIVNSAISDDSTGGDPVEGVEIRLLNDDGSTTGRDTVTDFSGRFSFPDVQRVPSMIFVDHPGNVTTKVLIVPGDYAQISITLTPGDGEEIIDMMGESHLGQSVIIATTIAFLTLFLGLAGISGGIEAYRGKSYSRSWWLSFFGLWSRGMIFVGPLLILIGMGLVTLSKEQFSGDGN